MKSSMTRRRLLPALILGVLCTAALPACSKARAQTPAPPPALNVPEAPARMNIPVNPDPVPPPEPPPAATADKPVTGPPASTTTKPRPTPTPTPTPAPPVQTPVIEPQPGPVRLAQSNSEERARVRLAEAVRDIGKVKKDTLPRAAKEQYDSAERFIRAAKSALSVKNFVYAFYCADKAATLAELLVKRS
jgi:outer membrane biosynthesis protein TonB